MTDNRRRRDGLGYMLPVLLFVLFFAVCSSVLACVFLRAQAISTQAKAYNDGVQLCRNQAERFRAGEEAPEMCCYDSALQPAEPEQAEYYVTMETFWEDAAVGQLRTARIRAFSVSGGGLYELKVTRYCPAER